MVREDEGYQAFMRHAKGTALEGGPCEVCGEVIPPLCPNIVTWNREVGHPADIPENAVYVHRECLDRRPEIVPPRFFEQERIMALHRMEYARERRGLQLSIEYDGRHPWRFWCWRIQR